MIILIEFLSFKIPTVVISTLNCITILDRLGGILIKYDKFTTLVIIYY